MEQQVIRETLSVVTSHITDQDKELAAEFNRTAWRALAVANRYLRYGPESARQSVVNNMIRVLSKLSAVSAESELEEHRNIFLREMQEMKALDAASFETLIEITDDQDE